jgi:hypothetical protein
MQFTSICKRVPCEKSLGPLLIPPAYFSTFTCRNSSIIPLWFSNFPSEYVCVYKMLLLFLDLGYLISNPITFPLLAALSFYLAWYGSMESAFKRNILIRPVKGSTSSPTSRVPYAQSPCSVNSNVFPSGG